MRNEPRGEIENGTGPTSPPAVSHFSFRACCLFARRRPGRIRRSRWLDDDLAVDPGIFLADVGVDAGLVEFDRCEIERMQRAGGPRAVFGDEGVNEFAVVPPGNFRAGFDAGAERG